MLARWIGRPVNGSLLPLPPAVWLGARASRGQAALGLALAAPVALTIQVAAGSWRNRALNPMLRLRPGRHTDRIVAEVQIPMREGYLPALHLAPQAGATSAKEQRASV